MSPRTLKGNQQLEILPLDAEARKALVELASRLRPHRDELIERWMALLLNAAIQPEAFSENDTSYLVEKLIDLFLDRIEQEQFDEYFADAGSLTKHYAALGLTYETLVLIVHLNEKVIVPILMRQYRRRDELLSALLAMDQMYHNLLAILASNYFGDTCAGLERSNREFAALFAVTAAVSSTLDIDVILENALDEMLRAMRLTTGEILILNPETNRLELRAHRGLPSSFTLQERAFSIGEGLPGLVAQKGRPVIIPDFPDDPRLVRSVVGHKQLRCAIGIPLLARDRVVGVMDFFGAETIRLDQQDIKLLSSIGSQIGTAIENATLYQTLQARTVELEESRRRREDFTSMVVHEFRGLLTVLTGYAQMLSKTFSKCEKCDSRLPTGTLVQARRLARLVDDLAEVSQIEGGRFQLDKAPVNIVALIREVVDQQQQQQQQRQRTNGAEHRLILDAPPEPIIGVWDADRITQVLVNLVGNAVKYSPDGGEVAVVIAARGDEVEVSVSDQGIGIAPEDLPHLFQPFSRLYRRQEIKGTGLGLYISKSIVEAHGGRIWAHSKLGAGTTFTLYLPLA